MNKVTKPKRNYSRKTLKVLFALSGNQCAHPDCTNALIESATEKSDTLVTAHICHIYAFSADGPRGRAELTQNELNAPENLILLCRNHHAVVDGQHETYPAEMLKKWKRSHESEMQKRISADLQNVLPEMFYHPYFPTALVDQKINNEVDNLRKSRFFYEFDKISSSLSLGRRIIEGELSGGTDKVKSCALAWCARLLSTTKHLDKADEYLRFATSLGNGSETDIAKAFIISQRGDKRLALTILAKIDSRSSRSAAFMIVAHHDGAEGAINWLKSAEINVTDLDADGKHVLLIRQLELARWKRAVETLDAISEQDLEEMPILHHMIAITNLLNTVPTEYRTVVLNQLPFEAAGFPLASDASAIAARRKAYSHFIKAAEVAQQLNCPGAAKRLDEYALWLELKDPKTSIKGKQRLEAKLRDPKSALRLVQLALQFGIKLDLVAVEQKIEQQITINGGLTNETAFARFALAFTQKTPEAVANYIDRYYDELSIHIDKKSMRFLQIEMLSRAGLPERANECLKFLLTDGLTEAEESRLRRVIAEAKGTDPIEARKAQFKQTDSLGDLEALVDALESKEEWDSLCNYGKILFNRTHAVRDAERLANALHNAQKPERIVKLLRDKNDLLSQSKNLQIAYCWSLFDEGALLEARSELAKLSGDSDNPSCRALQVNLGIALGDWNSLSEFVANEYLKRDQRSAQDLMGAAQLALQLDSPYAKELIFAATDKGNDDAGVLAAGYFLASQAGWEDDNKVIHWLHRAALLSGDNGPIQQMSLKDVLERKPEWDRRDSDTWQLLSSGEIPMFLAAQSLNRSLIDLMLFPALTNLVESDPRRRGAISAFSGKRKPTQPITARIIGMDATALVTLSFLNLLDKALDAFDMVHVPHSTLAWLFQEKQKAAFHQPSRIMAAHQLRHLLSTDVIEKFVSSTVTDSELSAQVGDELAMLIAEAENVDVDEERQRLVVCSSPVHRVASLMEEEADLTEHACVLSSCLSIVDKLRQKGQLTSKEEKRARSYLQLQEKPWHNQPEINDGAILYLDDLTITYFLKIGILEKLKIAGFRLIASPRKVSESNELISYEGISGKVNDAIDRIRSAVGSRIEAGSIKVSRRRNVEGMKEESISFHPTVGVFNLARDCDAIISDDRFLNQHENVIDAGVQAPIYTTLDILHTLVSYSLISQDDHFECTTLLRRAGYFFVPVKHDELATHLASSLSKDEMIIETAELKTIRESILHVRMSNWLNLPKEALWLDLTLKMFISVLKSLWLDGSDPSSTIARSNWILDQVEIRGWAQCFGFEIGDNIIKNGRGLHVLMLLFPPFDASQEIKNSYWSWVEDRVLVPIKEQYTDLYNWIVEWQRKQISEMADIKLTEGEAL